MTSQLDLSHRQPLLPLGSDFSVRFYDDARLDRYKEAVLAVLERTGVKFGSAKALALLEEHGARVDRETGIVRFAPDLVERALAAAPRSFWLGSRDGTLDLDLASGSTFNTTNGCGTEVIDWRTGERRPPTKEDLGGLLEGFVFSAHTVGVSERVREVAKGLPAELRAPAFTVAVALAMVDDDASEHEEELVGVLAEALGLEDRVSELTAAARRAASGSKA